MTAAHGDASAVPESGRRSRLTPGADTSLDRPQAPGKPGSGEAAVEKAVLRTAIPRFERSAAVHHRNGPLSAGARPGSNSHPTRPEGGMSDESRWGLFAVLLAAVAAFIWRSSLSMPDVVASHFSAAGIPNGQMPREVYLGVMLGVGVCLPALAVGLSWLSMGRPNARINLPNGTYWLAPERRARTVARLRASMMGFGAGLAVFLAYCHWLVVRANLSQPVLLENIWFSLGLIVFLLGTFAWICWLVLPYRRVPPGG
jgi:hypothetical protein